MRAGPRSLPLLLFVVSGCADGAAEALYEERMEDGRLVVETSAPGWGEPRALAFGVLFEVASDPETDVFLSEIVGAVRLEDGGVAMLDRQLRQVLVYGSDGQLKRRLGREGDAPGELRNPISLARLDADTLMVYDARNRRLTKFAPRGGDFVERSLDREVVQRPPVGIWRLDAGALLLFEADPRAPDAMLRGRELLRFGPRAIVRTLGAAGEVDTLHAEGVSRERMVRGDRPFPTPYGRATLVAARDDRIVISWSHGIRVDQYVDGALTRSSIMPSGERPLEQSSVAHLRDSVRAEVAATGETFVTEETFEAEMQPDSIPPFSAIRLDDDGQIFLREFVPFNRVSRVWWVISPEGVFLGRIALPEGADLLAVDGEEAVLLRLDELDVPRVQVVAVDWERTLSGG